MVGSFFNKVLSVLAGIALLAATVFGMLFKRTQRQLDEAEQALAQADNKAQLRDDIDQAHDSLASTHNEQRRQDDAALKRGDRNHLDGDW